MYLSLDKINILIYVIVFLTIIIVGLFFIAIKKLFENKKLKKALLNSECSYNSLNSFISHTSHDVHTQLNSIIGLSDNQIVAESDEKHKTDMFSSINTSGRYLLYLMDDIYNMTTIRSHRVTLSLRPGSIESVFSQVYDNISHIASEKGVAFSIVKHGLDERYIMADFPKLSQILSGLVLTALAFTPKGGLVSLSASRIRKDDTYIYDRFTISDNGNGISSDYIKHMYEPYQKENGTEISMPIVKNLIDLFGGTLTVKSETGLGSIFTVELRFKRCTSQDVENISLLANNDGNALSGKCILVCEDNQINLEIAKKLLHKDNIIIETALNGQECIDLFKSSPLNHFNAILMDVVMPIKNGLDATIEIRKLSRLDARKIPIIAMTANTFESDIKACIDAGMNAHIAKPIAPKILHNTLAELIK